MAVICICGFCIPYSVFWPLLVIFAREVWNFLTGKKSTKTNSSPEKDEISKTNSEFKGGHLGFLTKEMNWKDLSDEQHPLFLKFTAKWCKPCKEIDPFVQKLAEANASRAAFVNVDVDEFDTLAAEFGALSIPLFVCVRNGKIVEKLSGKDQEKLSAFVMRNLPQ